MPGYYLRKLEKKSHWYKSQWEQTSEIHADALEDIRTNSNRLSIWYVSEEMSNLASVIAALASNRDSLNHIDYVLLPENFCSPYKIEQTRGDTKLGYANEQFHYEMVELTVRSIAQLAILIISEGTIDRKQKSAVQSYINDEIMDDRIRIDQLPESIREKFL